MQYLVINKIVDRVLILMLIMSTGGMLFVLNRNIASIVFFILLLFCLIFVGSSFKKIVVRPILLSFFSCLTLGIINYLFAASEQSLNKYGFHLLTLVISILVLLYFKNNRTNNQTVNGLYFVLKLILIHSIFNFFFFFFVKNNLSVVSSSYHEYDTFLNIFFYSSEKGIVSLFGVEFCRNQGFFWEPGVLQGFLNILFFLEAFIIKKNKIILLISALAILTTYSTTGLALLLIQILYYIRKEFKINFATFLVTIIAIPLYFILTLNMNEKIYGERESSFQKRLFDLTQPLFIAIENPLTGIGLDIEQFQNIRSEFYFSSSTLQNIQEKVGIQSKVVGTDKGSSNSIMFLFASMGFPTAIILLLMLFNQSLILNQKNLFIFIVVILVMSEPLLLRPFFFMLIVSGFFNYFKKITSYKEQII
tara:strand:+ start:307 stop:1566 length:1260 start_codon:yes stop_codon:yes gene_type:complete